MANHLIGTSEKQVADDDKSNQTSEKDQLLLKDFNVNVSVTKQKLDNIYGTTSEVIFAGKQVVVLGFGDVGYYDSNYDEGLLDVLICMKKEKQKEKQLRDQKKKQIAQEQKALANPKTVDTSSWNYYFNAEEMNKVYTTSKSRTLKTF